MGREYKTDCDLLTMRIILILCVILSLFQSVLAQKNAMEAEPIMEEGYNGSYYQIHNPIKLSPIEQKMKDANFCEISGEYILVPNYATEAFDDGVIPIDEMSFEIISLLLSNDVVRYYHLQDEYNTPLMVKRFKSSEEYRSLKERFDEERKNFLNGTYYAITDVNSEFDLNKGAFTIRLPFYGYDNRVSLKSLDRKFNYGSFTTPQIDEDTAFIIESNPCMLVAFVKFTGEITGFDIKECVCNPIKVYIANKQNGEIYLEYSPTSDNRNQSDLVSTIKREVESEPCEEEQPQFPGGDMALFKFVSQNLVYPEKAAKDGVEGRVIVQFTVDKDGVVKNPIVTRGWSPELDAEAIRVFSLSTMPKWKPGTRNGEPVEAIYTCPITFKMHN